ncbi:MAG: hypothetical protein GEV06_06125 [Luteitalea sp.]|nr:hypothetical protein [Luteitalea sp.]
MLGSLDDHRQASQPAIDTCAPRYGMACCYDCMMRCLCCALARRRTAKTALARRRAAQAAGLLAGVLLWSAATTAHAWSFDVHRYITDRAIALLSPEIRPFFEKHRAMIVEHSIDPDLWRNVGFDEETPRHFLDLDAYGPYPFSALPRDYHEAVLKFGPEKVRDNGTLPWRTQEIYARLVQAFARQQDDAVSYGAEDVKFFAAVLAHYVADAHVPFHAVTNYDGQLSNQHGIHERFESELFFRFRDELHIAPAQRPPIRRPRDEMFEALIESARLAPGVFAADTKAIGAREMYDERYYETFFAEARPILEGRMGDAIAAVAAAINGAWETAGKPNVSINGQRRPERRRLTPGK